MSIRLHDVLSYGGGECLQRFGVPWLRMTRAQHVAPTCSRASIGSAVDREGMVRYALADRMRVEWRDADGDGEREPYLLTESEGNNLCLWSEAIGTSPWGPLVGTESVASNAEVAPDGAATADTLTDTSATEVLQHTQATTVAADDVRYTWSIHVHKTAHSGHIGRLRLGFQGGTPLDAYVRFDPSDGSWQLGGDAVDGGVLDLGGDYWRAWVSLANNSSNTTAVWGVEPSAYTTLNGSANVTLQGYQTLWGAQFEAGVGPSSYVATGAANATRESETLSRPIHFPILRSTLYLKGIELGSAVSSDIATGYVFRAGNAGSTAPSLQVVSDDSWSYYGVQFANGIAAAQAEPFGAVVTWGQLFELLIHIDANEDGDGDLAIAMSVQGGDPVSGTASGPNGGLRAGTPWSAPAGMFLGPHPTFSQGWSGWAAEKWVRGIRGWSEMQGLFS